MTGKLLLLLGWLALVSQALAHPSHTSFAEIGWNEAGDRLEVSLRVIPEDLEGALGERAGTAVALEDTPQTRTLVNEWLEEVFIVQSPDENFNPQLVGMELAYDETWLYFTIAATRSTPLSLTNRVLYRYNRNRQRLQLNQVQRLWEPAANRMVYSEPESRLLWTPLD